MLQIFSEIVKHFWYKGVRCVCNTFSFPLFSKMWNSATNFSHSYKFLVVKTLVCTVYHWKMSKWKKKTEKKTKNMHETHEKVNSWCWVYECHWKNFQYCFHFRHEKKNYLSSHEYREDALLHYQCSKRMVNSMRSTWTLVEIRVTMYCYLLMINPLT